MEATCWIEQKNKPMLKMINNWGHLNEFDFRGLDFFPRPILDNRLVSTDEDGREIYCEVDREQEGRAGWEGVVSKRAPGSTRWYWTEEGGLTLAPTIPPMMVRLTDQLGKSTQLLNQTLTKLLMWGVLLWDMFTSTICWHKGEDPPPYVDGR